MAMFTESTALYCTFSCPAQPSFHAGPSQEANPSVVGYSQYALTNASQMVTVSFKNVASEVIDLTSIKVVGYTGACSDKAVIQLLQANGNVATYSDGKPKMYYWQDSDGASGKWVRKSGRTTITINEGDVTLAIGDAMWCQKTMDGLSFLFSGEVIQVATDVSLPNSSQAVGNMMATPVDLTNVTVGGYTGATTDKVVIQILQANGNVATYSDGKPKMYYWQDSTGSSGKWVRKSGRTTITINEGDVVFAPGDGLWVQNMDTTTAYKLVFAAPSL